MGNLKNFKICVIKGDGIGVEVIDETVRMLKAYEKILKSIHFEFIEAKAGLTELMTNGNAIPNETIEIAKECDAILFGAITSPKPTEISEELNKSYKSPILTLRKELDLYANVRPTIDYKSNIDFVIIRENTEGLYIKDEYYDEENEFAIAKRKISKKGSERIIKFAFEYAKSNNRKKVSCIHKSNVLRITDGLFLKTFEEIAQDKKYNGIEANDYLVDATAMYIIKSPEIFDVMATTNLFGDILSDEASALGGGLGLAPSANIGDKYALFEPVHGSAPDIAGKGIANPMATMLCCAMMLDYLKIDSEPIKNAVKRAFLEGNTTADLSGCLTTKEVADKIIDYLN
ncbi:homoisocitrate dehydrogenase [Methanococcus voltae]|uniref:3-isopropylmalate dehydrogenase n=1 Tax=Methanococcus voltae (strain ATCC BAA-1334 / A3) TaxID=456320 RepID=D7DTJ0_METV3|nr:homoisocitrate dehydrogenase [Methanococcus voltae]MCS3901302.1 methanogen homoisocitrate dehydrogenase [Methanococcus voltae]